MRSIRATAQLLRLDSSILAFLSVLLPVLSRTRDINLSLGRSLPLFFIAACTFIINDIEDIEKDKINHPHRPLPSGQVSPPFVAVLYYLVLALALLTTRFFVTANGIAFWHYLLLTMSISYGYVVEYLPGLKAPYVAGASSIPVVILAAYYPRELELYIVAAAILIFTLGRELCMDLVDRPGDPSSFMHRIPPGRVAVGAFTCEAFGIVLVSLVATRRIDLSVVLAMIALFAFSCRDWFALRQPKRAIILMKLVIFCGLYFLF